MTEPPRIDVRPEHGRIVRAILRRLAPGRGVWAFGSRATGSAKEYSDLDLVILGEVPLGLSRMAELAEAFQESDLPFKVDVLDWTAVTPSFRKIIEADKVVLIEARA